MTHRLLFGLTTAVALLAGTASPEIMRADLDALLDSSVHGWRWKLGEMTGAEAADFDDTAWERVDIGFKWWPHDSTGWFRVAIVIPEEINGIPVQGAAVRLRLGVDNQAEAYVNGVLQQQFLWAGGDIVLTEKAHPGDKVTVALHAANGPGYGSLYQAYLVSETAEPMADAVRDLLKDFDAAVSDAACVPVEEADHWVSLIRDAMQALDMEAYKAADTQTFLASADAARGILLSDLQQASALLDQTAQLAAMLRQRIDVGAALGFQLIYDRADLRVIESFLEYVRQDSADPVTRHKIRALKTAAFLERLSRQAMDHSANVLEGKSPDLKAPSYSTGSLVIRDGAFWQGNRPVFFTGVGHFDQVRQDIPILNEYGLNMVQFEMGPNTALPNPETVDYAAIEDRVAQWLDRAAEHNVAVNLLISPHYFPQWARDSDPAHARCGSGFLKYCIEAPSTREVMEKWLDALMTFISGRRALHSICLSNEPQYKGQCEYDRALFRDWLLARHGTLDNINAFYGAGFASTEDIAIPKDATASYALFFDWCRFNQERFLEFHKMLRERVHRYIPKLPVHAKVMSLAFEDPGQFEQGINFEDFNCLDRIAGNDCGYKFVGEQPGPYKADWLAVAMNYTLQHCTAPDSPIFNSENHLIADGEPRYIPGEHIRAALWQQALHGQCATAVWVWDRGQDGDLAENILTRADCVRALGHIGLDLNRLAVEVHALQRAQGPFALFYSYSSLLPSSDYTDEAKAAFEGAYFTDAVCDVITERQAAQGKLAQYKLVIVPRAGYAPDAVVQGFNDYIAQGGTVMTVGACFTHDEYARPRVSALVQSGEGRLIAYPDPLSPEAYRGILDRLLDAAQCPRPVRVTGAYGEPVWGVNLRAVKHEGRWLVSLLDLTHAERVVSLRMDAPVQRMVNLFDQTEVTAPLTLAPLEPVLLSVESDEKR